MKQNMIEHEMEHTWETECTIDEGVYYTVTLRLCLYFSVALNKYVVSGKGSDLTWGRHWNREGIPDKLFSNYADALKAYRKMAHHRAPYDVAHRVESDVKQKLKLMGLE